ncbi:peptidylprolyl isomerase [Gordonia shandongensis]|uniref:peptidylprolyl isomerase n=1 Tax=Gordonia shandongensis TaxID=376351 RepID=UPI00040FDC6D|nr:peptidylprolyl isomerase [Gordonia shandongensis]
MSTNEERREAARRKLEERLERERQAARRRMITLIAVCGVAVLAAGALGGYFYYRHWDNERHTECTYTDADRDWDKMIELAKQQVDAAPPEQKAEAEKQLAYLHTGDGKARTAPKPESRVLNTGTVDWTLTTNRGEIPVTLDRSDAACNVNAVISLSSDGYYDGTVCHRLAQSDRLRVLQCGDPTGTGAGSPGWTSPDELDVPEGFAPGKNAEQYAQVGMAAPVVYPRGTIAIANSNNPESGTTDTGSAQFFVVTKDTELPPTLSVVGHVDDAGMKVIDEVAGGGIDPGPIGTPEDGLPKERLEIKSTSVSDD